MLWLGVRPALTQLRTAAFRSPQSIADIATKSGSNSTVVARNPSKLQSGFISRIGLRHASGDQPAIKPLISWNEFFKLRKKRRIYTTVSSVITAVAASSAAFEYFANLVIDFNKTVMGIEIQWIYVGGIVASAFLGYVVGPFFGNRLFNMMLGKRRASFVMMDDIFLRHISRNRPDPSRHNVNTNPLPDYYGEKIGSLHDYRQWLREVHLFEKKAKNFL